ncbi:rifin PIR protein, putative [Plasmodium reichenowi]|uniref:Rifin PIR protein, putative n=1 Tax=Plasmodium reichenowi TaxID=5854 RepID=A0A2P9DT75_PLARE|nr:rifin PIR protein, putative [Plasmodium reichenowi]
MEKSLADKIEKGCLRCGCALGGGVLPIWGLVGGLWYATWSQYVTQKALAAGIEKGITTVVSELKDVAQSFSRINIHISEMVNAETYRCPNSLTTSIYAAKENACVGNMVVAEACTEVGEGGNPFWFNLKVLNATTKGISAAKSAEEAEIATANAASAHLFSAIGYFILAILIIVLVMIIIYLVLRYRRKKKMNRKAQYTKLLNQ